VGVVVIVVLGDDDKLVARGNMDDETLFGAGGKGRGEEGRDWGQGITSGARHEKLTRRNIRLGDLAKQSVGEKSGMQFILVCVCNSASSSISSASIAVEAPDDAKWRAGGGTTAMRLGYTRTMYRRDDAPNKITARSRNATTSNGATRAPDTNVPWLDPRSTRNNDPPALCSTAACVRDTVGCSRRSMAPPSFSLPTAGHRPKSVYLLPSENLSVLITSPFLIMCKAMLELSLGSPDGEHQDGASNRPLVMHGTTVPLNDSHLRRPSS
jgi:hypothetical protein